jgi:ABC-type multidrug transport system fused ATPase/permease subunit
MPPAVGPVNPQNVAASVSPTNAVDLASKAAVGREELQQQIKSTDMTDVILAFFKSRPGTLAGYILSLLVATVVNLIVLTKLTATIYRQINLNNRSKAFLYFGLLAVAMFVMIGLNYAVDFIEADLMPDFNGFSKKFFMGRVLHHNSQQYLNENPITYRNMVSTSCSSLSSVFAAAVQNYMPNAVLTLVTFGFLAYLDWRYFLVFMVAAAIMVALFLAQRDDILQRSCALEDHENAVKTDMFDVFRSLDTVVVKNTSHAELETLDGKIQTLREAEEEFLHMTNAFSYLTYAIITAAIVTTMTLALNKLGTPETPVTSIILAMTLMTSLRGKLQNVAATNMGVMKDNGRFTAVQMDALRNPPTIEAPEPFNVAQARAQASQSAATSHSPVVRMADVSYSYPKADSPVLQRFTWTMWQGINCLRGVSGCGKSTIGRLLVGLYRDYEGSITISGEECSTMTRARLRSLVTLSQQSMAVLDRTVRETILYGSSDGDVDEAELQTLWGQVAHVYNGLTLDSTVGINGGNLSTGQLQLLRMLGLQISSQMVVVLDEPCSGLDPVLKKAVLNIIKAISATKTVILITHDEATASVADRIKHIYPPSK